MLLIICEDLASHKIERKYNKMGIHRSLKAYKENIQIEGHQTRENLSLFAHLLPQNRA